MANEFVQTMADARIDAQSLSDFVFKPSGFKVARRLAPTIDTLQFYINRFNTLDGDFKSSVSTAVSSLNNSVAEAEGKVAYIETTVQDAINNTAVDGGVLADTFVVVDGNQSQRDVNQKTTRKYNSVVDMVADTKLKANQFVEVLGYYAMNDGGGCTYKVSGTGVADGGSVVALSNGLFAKAVFNGTYKTSQWGIKDGVDATTNIRKMMDFLATIPQVKKIIFDRQVSAEKQTWVGRRDPLIVLPSNSVVIADKSKPVKLITPDISNRYALVSMVATKNIIIKSLVVDGALDRSLANTGEWGMGFNFESTENTILMDCHTNKTGGDGFYFIDAVSTPDVPCKHTYIHNCTTTTSRRQGMSLITVDGFYSNNYTANDVAGTNPQAGICIEPNLDGQYSNNITFDNTIINSVVGSGFEVNLSRNLNFGERVNITVNNLTVNGAGLGGKIVDMPTGVTFIMKNIKTKNTQYSGIQFKNNKYLALKPSLIKVDGMDVKNADLAGNGTGDAAALYIDTNVPSGGYDISNITEDGTAPMPFFYRSTSGKMINSRVPYQRAAHRVFDASCSYTTGISPVLFSENLPAAGLYLWSFNHPNVIIDSEVTKRIVLNAAEGVSSIGEFKVTNLKNENLELILFKGATQQEPLPASLNLHGALLAPFGYIKLRHVRSRWELLESSGLTLKPAPEPAP